MALPTAQDSWELCRAEKARMKGHDAMTSKRFFRVRLSTGGPLVIDCNGLILCFGEDTKVSERTALAPLNSTLDVRKVWTNE